jgi:hypothetical protein
VGDGQEEEAKEENMSAVETYDRHVQIEIPRDVIVKVSGTNAGAGGSVELRAFAAALNNASSTSLTSVGHLIRSVTTGDVTEAFDRRDEWLRT